MAVIELKRLAGNAAVRQISKTRNALPDIWYRLCSEAYNQSRFYTIETILPASSGLSLTTGVGVDPVLWTPLKSFSGVSDAAFSKRLSAGVPTHAMPAPDPEMRKVLLDYLTQAYPNKAPTQAGGWVNPFAPKP
jgi:hypothetical protein